MPKYKTVWSPADVERARRLFDPAALLARGIKLSDMERAVKAPGSGVSTKVYWWRDLRGRPPTEEQWAILERVFAEGAPQSSLAGQGYPSGPPLDSTEAQEDRYARWVELAGDPDPDEEDELRAIALKHRKAAIGRLVDLLNNARSESVVHAACESLLSRTDGKPQRQVLQERAIDDGDNIELLSLLYGMRCQRLQDKCAKATAAELDQIRSDARDLPQEYIDRLVQRIDERRKELES